MKLIICKWIKTDDFYEKEMRIVFSNHERFVVGSRFDFGFMNVTVDEGYMIQLLPYEVK